MDNSEVCSTPAPRESLDDGYGVVHLLINHPLLNFLPFHLNFLTVLLGIISKNKMLAHKSLQQSSAFGETRLKHPDSCRMSSFSSTSISCIVFLPDLCTYPSLPSFLHLIYLPSMFSKVVLSYWFLWEIQRDTSTTIVRIPHHRDANLNCYIFTQHSRLFPNLACSILCECLSQLWVP